MTFTNKLTNEIKKRGDITIEEILSNDLFWITAQKGANELLKFFFPEEEIVKDNPSLPNFDKLIDYAFTEKNPEEEACYLILDSVNLNDEKYLPKVNCMYQLNRNAANFLSSETPTTKIRLFEYAIQDKTDRIFKTMKEFCFDDRYANQNPIFVGHFARIFPSWFAKFPQKFRDDEKFFNKLYNHAIMNVHILGYSELINQLIVECMDHIDLKSLLSQILRHIIFYIQVKYEEDKRKLKSPKSTNGDEIVKPLFSKEEYLKNQPLNINFERIPVPGFSMVSIPPKDDLRNSLETEIGYYCEEKDKCKKLYEENIHQTGGNIPDISVIEYLLISIIRASSKENSGVFDEIQKDNSNILIKFLLYIGVYGYENSSLSSEAFRILETVINGSEISKIEPLEINDSRMEILNKYADLIEFRPDCLSLLNVHSFPIFWNHKYLFQIEQQKEIRLKKPPLSEHINIKYQADIKNDQKTIKIKKEELGKFCESDYTPNQDGVTPFLILTPIVMTEPSLNTELNYHYIAILKRLCKERKKCTEILSSAEDLIEDNNNINKLPKDIKEVLQRELEIDKIMIDWLLYRFRYPTKRNDPQTIIEVAEKVFPLCPQFYLELKFIEGETRRKKFQGELKNGMPRAVINGTHLYINKLLFKKLCLAFFFEGPIEREIMMMPDFYSTSSEEILKVILSYRKIIRQAKTGIKPCGKKELIQINGE